MEATTIDVNLLRSWHFIHKGPQPLKLDVYGAKKADFRQVANKNACWAVRLKKPGDFHAPCGKTQHASVALWAHLTPRLAGSEKNSQQPVSSFGLQAVIIGSEQ